jgi:hypothetical protein
MQPEQYPGPTLVLQPGDVRELGIDGQGTLRRNLLGPR